MLRTILNQESDIRMLGAVSTEAQAQRETGRFEVALIDAALPAGAGIQTPHTPSGRGGTAAARATGGREPAGINFVAFDVVEVLPAYDNAGGITALLGANVAWEMIALLAWRKKMNP